MARIKIVSLFAGIGGFELGLKDLGEVIWANEWDKYACQTYRANFPNIKLVEGDIREIKAENIPAHDLLCAGFPCQTFSIAQSKKENKGLNDKRSWLFKEILQVAEYHKPTWILLENVKGLTFKNNKEAFDLIIKGIEDLGYKVNWKILNAKNYGVPQNRERIYFVCNRIGVDFEWPTPTNQPTKISDILLDEVDDKYYLSNEAWEGMKLRKNNGHPAYGLFKPTDQDTAILRARYYKDGSEILLFCDRGKGYHDKFINGDNQHPTITTNPQSVFYDIKNTDPKIFQYRRNYIRENKENQSPTLTANMGIGGNNVPFVFQWRRSYIRPNKGGISPCLVNGKEHVSFDKTHTDSKNPRKLTPRECARLQGFSDDFKIVVSDTQAYKQFGNAVAVPVIKAIAEQLKLCQE